MSPGLRPLQLPLLVEHRRKLEEEQNEASFDHTRSGSITSEAYSSEPSSPITQTFTPRGHLRYSSSTSSFDLSTPAGSEGPSSPAQASHKPSKRALPDVQEEPVDLQDSDDDLGHFGDDDFSDLYDCLCSDPCLHRDADLDSRASDFYTHVRRGPHDVGYLSDGDFQSTKRSSKRRLGGTESPLSGMAHRFGRFPGLGRWKSSRQGGTNQAPTSEIGLDHRPSLSRAASSRSSSRSASGRYQLDRSNEPPLPPTPALSFYDSCESILATPSIDVHQAGHLAISEDIDRERALATTPLLPPMLNDTTNGYMTALPSPLESPTIAAPILAPSQSPFVLSPPLSTKPSISSFHRIGMSGELPRMSEEEEEWANRLGHANFTIVPAPYKPDIMDLDSLKQLRSYWDTARVNYTKHLVRTGEHYGTTSTTYALTEEKWAQIDATWRKHHEQVAEAVIASGAAMSLPSEANLFTVPRMDTEGKFPERGDEDIVGPMVREVSMLSMVGECADKKASNFWRSLAGRVGFRK